MGIDERSFDRCVLVSWAVVVVASLAWATWISPELRRPIGIAVGAICLIVACLAVAIAVGGATLSHEGGENKRVGR